MSDYAIFPLMKKSLILSLAFLMIGGSATATFFDVSEDDFYYKSIDFLDEKDIVNGYQDGSFKQENQINRAEMLKIVVGARFVGQDRSFLNDYSGQACFNDIAPNQWYTSYVCYAKEQGWVQGYEDGNFRPDSFINFVEGLKIVLEVFQVPHNEGNPWYRGVVQAAADDNLIPLTIKDFAQFISRSEMADMIARKVKFDEGELDQFLGEARSALKVDYASIEAKKDVSYALVACDGKPCIAEPMEEDNGQKYCAVDGGLKYAEGEVVQEDTCTRCTCSAGDYQCTNLCIDKRFNFDDYYERVLSVSNFTLYYNLDFGGGEMGLNLENTAHARLDNKVMTVYLLDENLGVVGSVVGTYTVGAEDMEEYEEVVIEGDAEKLATARMANFYMDGYYFQTLNVEPRRKSIVVGWTDEGSSFLEFLLDDYDLGFGQKFHARCDSDSDPEAPHYYIGDSLNFQIDELLSLTTYSCTVALWEDETRYLISDPITLTTKE